MQVWTNEDLSNNELQKIQSDLDIPKLNMSSLTIVVTARSDSNFFRVWDCTLLAGSIANSENRIFFAQFRDIGNLVSGYELR